MALTNMQVFITGVRTLATEVLEQNLQLFNKASGGAITIDSSGFSGDFLESSFYNSLKSAQRRVDRYSANGVIAPVDLSEGKFTEVKIAGGFGPVRFEPAQMTWINSKPEEALAVISESVAEAMLDDMVNTTIGSLVAAISNQVDATLDISDTNGASQSALNKSDALFGDKSMALRVRIMRGATYHKLINEAITNDNTLFISGNVTIVNILNKPILITDAPALRVDGSPTKEIVLSLVAGAAKVGNGENMVVNIDTNNGGDRIVTTYQTDYDYSLRIKGYSWDGGKSPLDDALFTGTNWDRVTNVKNSAGVILIGDEAKE